MRSIVHVAAGGAIVATVANPWIALPLAVLAHFAMDAIPHLGETEDKKVADMARQRWLVPLDAVASLVLMAIILATGSDIALLVVIGGVLCAAPDLLQIPRFIRFLRTGNPKPYDDWFSRFHADIQWCERSWGYAVELPIFIALLYVLFNNL